MDKTELKLCPFCGSEAKLKFGMPYEQELDRKQAFVQCKVCRAKTRTFFQTPYQSWEDTKRFAIETWNRRCDDADNS